MYSYKVTACNWGIGIPAIEKYAKGRVVSGCPIEAERLAVADAIKQVSKAKLKGEDFTEWGYSPFNPSDEHGGGWVEDATDAAEFREVTIDEIEPSPVHVVLEWLGYKPLFELAEVLA